MMRKVGALLGAVMIAGSLASPLRADESRPSRGELRPPVRLKSEKTALAWSVVGTLAPLAVSTSYLLAHDPSYAHADIASVGMLVAPLGPPLGYFYTGATGRALLGLGIRLAGLAGMIGGSYGLDNYDSDEDLMRALIIAGAGATLVSTLIDLAGVKRAVRRHNLRAQTLQLAFAPVASPRQKALGLQLQISF
ncbi:MAG TPA: hypothetical protein VLJ16_07175 [Acidobacteriota bacterium]|nr:hypothetical protein [Acidobacteriota bacterium]